MKKRNQTNIAVNDLYDVRLCSLWISGVLNNVFVSGLSDLVGLPVHPQWVTFSSVRACFGLPLSCLWSVFPASRIFFH